MQDLITKITTTTGLDTNKAEKAVGILLNLVATQGDKTKVDALFEKMPGSRELVVTHGGDNAGGRGFMGILAGGLMGGPLAMITKLQAIGLTVEQIKQVGSLTIDYAKAKAGIKAVREAAANIPGLNSYI
jgi:predicted lipid-binding transport protein (Tim44 family)